jgi:hypothetical protein
VGHQPTRRSYGCREQPFASTIRSWRKGDFSPAILKRIWEFVEVDLPKLDAVDSNPPSSAFSQCFSRVLKNQVGGLIPLPC